MKKWLGGSIVLLAALVIINTTSGISAFAKSGEMLPMQKQESIEIELNDDSFYPDEITIPNGKATTLILRNKGNTEHTFTVKDLGIDEEVKAGEEKSITVMPQKSGTYELICRFHVNEGMVGKVIVE